MEWRKNNFFSANSDVITDYPPEIEQTSEQNFYIITKLSEVIIVINVGKIYKSSRRNHRLIYILIFYNNIQNIIPKL